MYTSMRNFLIKPMLALAIAIPAMMAGNVDSAEARHKNAKRGAIIAGAIIGGALIYKHHKRKKYHRSHRKSSYGSKHHSGHRRHKVRRHHGHKTRGYIHHHGHYGRHRH